MKLLLCMSLNRTHYMETHGANQQPHGIQILGVNVLCFHAHESVYILRSKPVTTTRCK